MKNETNEQISSTNTPISKNFKPTTLTENINYGTISSTDIENGTSELVLMPPFEGDDGGISVACVGGEDSNSGSDDCGGNSSGNNNGSDCDESNSGSNNGSSSGESDSGSNNSSDSSESDSCSDCEECYYERATEAERASAMQLTLNMPVMGNLETASSEVWYKFNTNDATTYTIYTTGETDTIGRLYDKDGYLVTLNDDRAGSLNFRIVYPLDANSTYYVKVTAPGTITGCFYIYVKKKILVSKVNLSDANVTLDVGGTYTLFASVYPDNADNKRISFSSYNTDVATIDPDTGVITARSPGIASICAFDWNNDGEPGRCEVWVRGKKPVILIHGRTDDTGDTWGAQSDVCGCNNEYASEDEAPVPGKTLRYIDVTMQEIKKILQGHSEGGYLADYLTSDGRGYIKNANLFAFNYPNEDAVVHSAKKLKLYIDNLIDYAQTSGSDAMKACFFASRADCVNKNYNKFDIVAHSMGGLVARYYIENLGYDNHVDKLITVCTPHWGSGYADTSCALGILHKLCDHDLRLNSAMYGGDSSMNLECHIIPPCHNGSYRLTDELLYNKRISTKYYAIAGVDYKHDINKNDYCFELPTDLSTYGDVQYYLKSQSLYVIDREDYDREIMVDLSSSGDNMVGLLSQIGWIESIDQAPRKKVKMEKIYLDFDTDGGNGQNIAGFELLFKLHSKIPHRTKVMKQIYNYLNE